MRHVLLLLWGCVFGLTACATTLAPTQTPQPAPNSYQIALVMKTLTNPFFVEMERGAREAEAQLGVELIVRTAAQETSIAQQIAIVEQLIGDGVDAVVIAPGDSVELIPILKRAQDAGIVVVNIDNRLDASAAMSLGLMDVPFVGVNNESGAYAVVSVLSAAIDTPSQAVILEGIRGAKNAEDRKNGALRAFAENDNITVVAMETANWKIDEAYTATEILFEQNPNIDLIFAANDMMALGAVQYLEENGLNTVQVAGFDALEAAQTAVRAGTLIATVDQQAAQQGFLGVEYAVRLLKGEVVPQETLVDVRLITAETLGN